MTQELQQFRGVLAAETPKLSKMGHDLHVMAKEKFARKVAAEIDAMVEREAIDDLVIAAPPPIMSAITATLQDATGRRIIASTHKDFTKMPDGDLWPHLAEWIRPAHLPPA